MEQLAALMGGPSVSPARGTPEFGHPWLEAVMVRNGIDRNSELRRSGTEPLDIGKVPPYAG